MPNKIGDNGRLKGVLLRGKSDRRLGVVAVKVGTSERMSGGWKVNVAATRRR